MFALDAKQNPGYLLQPKLVGAAQLGPVFKNLDPTPAATFNRLYPERPGSYLSGDGAEQKAKLVPAGQLEPSYGNSRPRDNSPHKFSGSAAQDYSSNFKLVQQPQSWGVSYPQQEAPKYIEPQKTLKSLFSRETFLVRSKEILKFMEENQLKILDLIHKQEK